MSDINHNFVWPAACVSCGKSDYPDSMGSRKDFRLYGGQTSEQVGRKRWLYYQHYARGTAYICPSCYENARRIEETYIPKLQRFNNIAIVIGLILIPVSIILGMRGGFPAPYYANPFIMTMIISMLLVVVFCTLGISGEDASGEFNRAGWASFYISYKHRPSTKDVFKFSSKDYADKFHDANPDTQVVVGRTHRSFPIKTPDAMSCCIGGIIPVGIIFLVLSLLNP
ncbi:MAG: hypothetical protein ACFFFC_18195 [Candidatus Thorarchaeota archaeon]